jgi:hypothetical protein
MSSTCSSYPEKIAYEDAPYRNYREQSDSQALEEH